MTLLELLKSCDHQMRIRIFFGKEKHHFDITESSQMKVFAEYLSWSSVYDKDDSPGVEKWNVQNITFTEWGKEGDRIDVTEKVLMVHLM
jgi:hypothetical protein